MRILNRIVRITENGLRYEADPRHAEMIIKAMNLTSANTVSTPGVKVPTDQANIEADLIHEDNAGDHIGHDDDANIGAVNRDRTVSFDLNEPDVKFVTPYAELYGIHPRLIVATRKGWKLVSENADPFTGKSARVNQKRRSSSMTRDRMRSIADDRRKVINAVYSHGCGWIPGLEPLDKLSGKSFVREGHTDDGRGSDREGDGLNFVRSDDPKAAPALDVSTLPGSNFDELVGAVRTPSSKNKFQKRQGAKALKKVEMETNNDDLLDPDQATTFRGLSARGNYLSQDRVDINYSTKELCREFAAPANSSFHRLKRVARFLVGKPRLIYEYKWCHDEPMDTIEALVDTDFAGCRATRRSTSGGLLMRGGHCIRHWSTTQTTVALSSGEAELSGICRGASNAIGLCAVAKDLGINLKIVLKTDATAAIGMTRRLGIGKVRHLDTSLLWVQQKVRNGDLSIEKIPGVDNPADVLTKYVDAATMTRHLESVGLLYESGRAELAPKLAAD